MLQVHVGFWTNSPPLSRQWWHSWPTNPTGPMGHCSRCAGLFVDETCALARGPFYAGLCISWGWSKLVSACAFPLPLEEKVSPLLRGCFRAICAYVRGFVGL